MRLPARLRAPVPLLEDIFFAAGIVSVTTTPSMERTTLTGELLLVPGYIWLGLMLLGQGLPFLAITVASHRLRRGTAVRAHLLRALLVAAAIVFIGLRLGGGGFRLVASDLPGGLARWIGLLVYLILLAVASVGVVKLCLRHQQLVASICRTVGVPGAVVVGLTFVVLSADTGSAPAYQHPAPSPQSSAIAAASLPVDHPVSLPPVFLLVFDELSNQVLLDERGQIDRREFPNFARLADQSVMFTDMQANFFNTSYAVPSMVESLTPFTSAGELNLYLQFRDVEVALAPTCIERIRCVGISDVVQNEPGTIFRHLAVAFAEDLIPGPFSSLLRDTTNAAASAAGVPASAVDSSGVHMLTAPFTNRFLDDLRDRPPANSITVFHTLSTHYPYVLDVGGVTGAHPFTRDTHGTFEETGFSFAGSADDEPNQVVQQLQPPALYDAYRAQIRYGDELLGQFLDTLEAEGLLEQSVVIVTADHGQRPFFPDRETPSQVEDWTTRIPLLIRAPGLAPGTSNVEVQHRDLAATVFDLLDLDLESDPDTVSAFAGARPQRTSWFVVSGTWVHHRATDGTWSIVARLPDLPEFDRPGESLPPLNHDLLPCFAQPETCAAFPMLLAGTPEFEAALAD